MGGMLSRRAFLQHLSLGMGLALSGVPLPLFGAESAAQRYYIVGADINSACHIDLRDQKIREVPIGFSAHSFVPHPNDPYLAIGVQKWGPSAAVIDFKKEKVLHSLARPKGTEFYGHGVFFREKNAFFVGRVELESGQGHLIGYDADTFKEVYDYPVTVGGLHDCHLLPDRTLLLASSGIKPAGPGGGAIRGQRLEASGLVHVDLATGRVLGKKLIKDENQALSHFALAEDGTIVALSSPRPQTPSGEVYLGSVSSSDFRRLEWTDAFQKNGEMLSVSIDKKRHVAAVTNPGGSNLFFVNMRNGEGAGHRPMRAMGVAYDPVKEQFLFSGEGAFYADEKNGSSMALPDLKDLPSLTGAHGLLI
jgi:hypothetical protein